MRTPPSKLWAFGPPLSLLLVAFAYYVKVQSFREMVDRHFPWAKEHLAQFVSQPQVVTIMAPKEGSVTSPTDTAKQSVAPQTAPPTPAPLTIETIAATRALWPKTVRLRKSTQFPAVLKGKPVGTLQAPAGTEVNLVEIRNPHALVEFQGGSAWAPVADTDLLDRVKIAPAVR